MEKTLATLLVSILMSLIFTDLHCAFFKALTLPFLIKYRNMWAIYLVHVLTSVYYKSILEHTLQCLVHYYFHRPDNFSDLWFQLFFQLLSWFFFAGLLTSDILNILPVLATCILIFYEETQSLDIKLIESEIKHISEENRLYQEKIEAYRKIAAPIPISSSRRTSVLINKLKNMNQPLSFNPTRSFTEGSDHDSNSSEIEPELGSMNSSNKGESSKNSFISIGGNALGAAITNDEIKEIINNLVSQEYLMWNPEKPKDSEVDYMALASDVKQIYTQSIENLPGSSHNTIKIQKSKPTRLNSIRSMSEVPELLGEVLESIGEWDFDSFELIKVTKVPVIEVGLYIFSILGLPDRFSIDNSVLRHFLTAVENGYNRQNFYHNSIHAADVTASTLFLMQKGLSRCGNLMELDAFALVVAAICHDIGHPGLNNAFLVATGDELALKYNDQSCLENMHVNKSFTIIMNDSCNITKFLTKADYQRFRKNMISAILATDLQVHFDKVNKFRNNLEKQLDISDDKFRIMAIEVCLKCADIGHGARKLDIHKQWTSLITKEFFRQGDLEVQASITLTPLCDKNSCIISKSQIGFLEVLVKPLFMVWEEFVERNNKDESELEVKICLQNVMDNIEYWDNEYRLFQQGKPLFFLDVNPPPLSK